MNLGKYTLIFCHTIKSNIVKNTQIYWSFRPNHPNPDQGSMILKFDEEEEPATKPGQTISLSWRVLEEDVNSLTSKYSYTLNFST